MRAQFPNLVVSGEGSVEGGPEEEEDAQEQEHDPDEITPSPSPSYDSQSPSSPRAPLSSRTSHASIIGSSSTSNTPYTPHTTNLLLRTRHAQPVNLNPPNPSISPDGKWAPQHQWTHFYDMLYAKRCMAILTHRSPRKSNLVIMKGKQWIVDWATGKLTRCEPPEYGEVIMGRVGLIKEVEGRRGIAA